MAPKIYELLSRVALCAYCVILFISWSHQEAMSKEYDLLLQSILNFKGHGSDDLENAMQDYFDVKTVIYAETHWLRNNQVVSYVLCYTQFILLMFYFSAHPKMGVLTRTFEKIMGHLMHFLLVFFWMFLLLAFVAHWMLGGYIQEFATFGEAVKSQTRMLFGEFIHAENASELDTTMSSLYWVYATTFMLVVFFALLNFLLAIIVDGYVAVKQEEHNSVVASDFFSDCFEIVRTRFIYMKCGWPKQLHIHKALKAQTDAEEYTRKSTLSLKSKLKMAEEELRGEAGEESVYLTTTRIDPTYLMETFPKHFGNKDRLAAFLLYYYKKCKFILVEPPSATVESLSAMNSQKSKPSATVVTAQLSEGDV